MGDDAYRELREFLDRFPLGFPGAPSGVELEILRRLFTEDEAEVAVLLTPFPEDAADIAARSGLDVRRVRQKLGSMARKGLVFRVRRGDTTMYNAAPFMIGLYEYSVKRLDAGLAALFRKYYEEAYLEEMGASGVPGFKVVPVTERIRSDLTPFPYLRLEEEIRAARRVSVAECICRKEARLTGAGCDHPLETCLSFGAAADYYIENGFGREITAGEAVEILKETDRAGLIHAGTNTRHLSNICNCCPCCCASMKGITVRGYDRHRFLNALFVALVDEEECTGCEECVGRCPVRAISCEGTARVERNACLGCGLCAGACPCGAITLSLREDMEEPFDRVLDLGIAILDGKKKAAGGGG